MCVAAQRFKTIAHVRIFMYACVCANIISVSCNSFPPPANTRHFDKPLFIYIHSFNGSFRWPFAYACMHACVCTRVCVCVDPFGRNCYHFGGFRASLMCRWRLICSQMQTNCVKSPADVHAHIRKYTCIDTYEYYI